MTLPPLPVEPLHNPGKCRARPSDVLRMWCEGAGDDELAAHFGITKKRVVKIRHNYGARNPGKPRQLPPPATNANVVRAAEARLVPLLSERRDGRTEAYALPVAAWRRLRAAARAVEAAP